MAGLSAAEENRILLLGLGLTACAVVGVMRHMLLIYRDSVEVFKPPPKTQYITQGTEDSLRPSSLEKLINSHNSGIRETAALIVGDRALHDEATLDALLWEVTRQDYDRRERGIRALNLLSQLRNIAELNKPKVYSAIVKCLTYCIKDIAHEPYDKEFDNWELRDAVERICLEIFSRLVYEFGPDGVTKAGFVHRWLAMEPWGRTEKERQENFSDMYKTKRLSEFVSRIALSTLGMRELRKASLISDQAEIFNDIIDIRMINGEGTAGEPGTDGGLEGGPRVREHSAEERHLRRRHREAMVLNDGIAPIDVGDIIEREFFTPVTS